MRFLKPLIPLIFQVFFFFLLLQPSDQTALWHSQFHLRTFSFHSSGKLFFFFSFDQSDADVCLCVIEDAAESQDGFARSDVGFFSW